MTDETEGCSGPQARLPTQKEPLLSLDDIRAFDELLWEITKGLPIRTGSLLKVPCTYYERFGISLTAENRSELKALSERFYIKDIEEQLELERLRQQETAEETVIKRDTENKMAWAVAEIVREMMHTLDDGSRNFRLCDIGSGRGETAAAVAGELHRHEDTRELVKRVEFHLVDWSPGNLLNARAILHNMYGAQVYKHEYIDFENFLEKIDSETFDFIVSVARFHHKSFPDYLDQIKRTLANDGALVSGDWHSALWHHPYNLYRLLETFDIGEKRLSALSKLLSGFINPTPGWSPSPEEQQAMDDHFEYWHKVHSELKALRNPMGTRHYLLKANQTSKEHSRNLNSAGFITGPDDIRKAFPRSKLANLPRSMLRGSDFAVVTAAIKRAV